MGEGYVSRLEREIEALKKRVSALEKQSKNGSKSKAKNADDNDNQ